jgi:hypothetical protein
MACPGSVGLQATFPDRTSEPAATGTLLHEILATSLLTPDVGILEVPGDTFTIGEFTIELTEEMLGHVQKAMDWVNLYRAAVPNARVHTEQRSNVGEFFGCPDDLWGTADIVLTGPDELVVADFKSGFEEVDSEENPQISLYAIGLAHAAGWPWERYKLVILQPRSSQPVKVEVLTRDQLKARAEKYRPLVERALLPGQALVPTEAGCRWCRAAGACPELAKRSLVLAQREFSTPQLITREQLASVLAQAGMVRKALDACEQYAHQLLATGAADPSELGYKLVLSKRHRAWKDEGAVAVTLSLLTEPENLYEPMTLRSPAQMEKLLKLKPKTLDALAPAPPGNPVLAPLDDARPALPADFKQEEE